MKKNWKNRSALSKRTCGLRGREDGYPWEAEPGKSSLMNVLVGEGPRAIVTGCGRNHERYSGGTYLPSGDQLKCCGYGRDPGHEEVVEKIGVSPRDGKRVKKGRSDHLRRGWIERAG